MKHLWSMFVMWAMLASVMGIWIFSEPDSEKGLITLMTIGIILVPYLILTGMENASKPR